MIFLLVVFCGRGLKSEEAGDALARVWTSTAGTTITGTLAGVRGQKVSINTEEGKRITVPIKALLPADRSFAMNAFLEKSPLVIVTGPTRHYASKSRKKAPENLGWALPKFALADSYQLKVLHFFPDESRGQFAQVAEIHKALSESQYEGAERCVLLDPTMLLSQEVGAAEEFKKLMNLHENSSRTSGVALWIIRPEIPSRGVVYKIKEIEAVPSEFVNINGSIRRTQGTPARTVKLIRTPEECEEILESVFKRAGEKWSAIPVDEAMKAESLKQIFPVRPSKSDEPGRVEDVSSDFAMTLNDYLYDSALYSSLTYQPAPLRRLKRAQIAVDEQLSKARSSPLPDFSDEQLKEASEAIFSVINEP